MTRAGQALVDQALDEKLRVGLRGGDEAEQPVEERLELSRHAVPVDRRGEHDPVGGDDVLAQQGLVAIVDPATALLVTALPAVAQEVPHVIVDVHERDGVAGLARPSRAADASWNELPLRRGLELTIRTAYIALARKRKRSGRRTGGSSPSAPRPPRSSPACRSPRGGTGESPRYSTRATSNGRASSRSGGTPCRARGTQPSDAGSRSGRPRTGRIGSSRSRARRRRAQRRGRRAGGRRQAAGRVAQPLEPRDL